MRKKECYQRIKKIISLGFILSKANFKVRNEGSYLGIFWYLLYPLSMFLMLLFLIDVINRTDIAYFPMYLLFGLVIFNLFRQSTTDSIISISKSSPYIKNMKIDYESLILSSVFLAIYSHLFEILLLIVFMIYFKLSLVYFLFYPVILIFYLIFIVGFSFILSTLGVYIHDLDNIYNVFLNLLWFATPIFYVINFSDINFINKINPVFYYIHIFREIIIYHQVPSKFLLGLIIFISLVSFILGLFIFEKNKKRFAEKV